MTAATEKFFTSNRIPHDSGLYHEVIYYGDDIAGYVMSADDGTYWWAINGGSAISRGFKTVCDCKEDLIRVLS